VDDGNWKSKNHSNDDEDKSNNGNAAMLVTCTPRAQTVKTVKVQEGEILHQVHSKEDEKSVFLLSVLY
jgi:hypothetical protein